MTLRPLLSSIGLALALAGCATRAPAPPIDVQLVALNDFHGHLEASKFSYTLKDGSAPTVQAGGIDVIGAALQAWRKDDRELLLVGAGDLVGASPAMSSMWADEPSIAALNMLGMHLSSVGNHEFDAGRPELLRQLHGGCASPRPDKACKLEPSFGGADFSYLAANVIDNATGQAFLPAYRIETVKGVKIGFVGAVLKDTAAMVLASGIAGLTFIDEADAINRAIPAMRAEGATVFVVLIHEGGRTREAFDESNCSELKGPVVAIAKRLDPAVRLVISGHTHTNFVCRVDGRTITQAETAGHVLTRIHLTIDPASGALRDVAAANVVMQAGVYPPDTRLAAYLATVRARSAAALERPVARVALRSVVRKASDAGESPLGDLIADGVLDATRALGAQIGFMNSGGMRSDLDVAESLTASFGNAQVVLPFNNTLVLMDLSGAQLRTLLEQQWLRPAAASTSVLQISQGFSYRWNMAQAPGQRVVPGSMMLNGVPIDEAKTYRIAANNFLAEGGDNFPLFRAAAKPLDTQIRDLDAFVDYLVKRDRAGAPAGSAASAKRIERVK
ncbi:MAG TPA: bifunctional metallophosphatase/5'-nucleotidase [Telluria sp.]|nr:bifunctional metallophosphatase/5'-nucleotidase [Telluria sp.]